MIKFSKLALVPVMVALSPIAAHAATVNSSATLVNALTVGSTTSMGFGTIVPAATQGTVVLGTDGSRTATTVALSSVTGGAAGQVPLTGSGSATFTVTLSGSVTLTKSDDQSKTMTVDSFKVKVGSGSDQTSSITGALSSGSQTLYIGGTLTVPANATVGDYSTDHTGGVPLTVTVAYN